MTENNVFDDLEYKNNMEHAFLVLNPDATEADVEHFLADAEKYDNEYGEAHLNAAKVRVMSLLTDFFDFAYMCETRLIEFETAVRYKTIWAEMLTQNPSIEESLPTYQYAMNQRKTEVEFLLNQLSAQIPTINKQIDELLKICRFDEDVAKATYKKVLQDDELALKYIEGLKIILDDLPISTVAEARQDALKFYEEKKHERQEFENMKNNIPKIGKLKKRLNLATKDHLAFVGEFTQNQRISSK